MFKVGDQVKIVTTVFEEDVGTVVRVVPGRAKVIPTEFVVQIAGGYHRFFEEQLVVSQDVDSG
jgi:transcription antitermination factor NusG